ncbi:hypothetical protein FZEAL_864 [Fusarium zealandicum]|uniref:Inheritance of peroxisomes protein 1 n=1 Tax=Fusarium zealandicum TaxID=1053134 RepID=A0A8H4UTY6_9HYPO|nr:hypothetical protein FZEAL_864 [Fusarium zealandicum]
MDDSTQTPPPHHRVPRRVATAPMPLRTSMRPDSPDPESLVETLYSHPNAKIISFTASGRALSGRPVFPREDEPGTLAWSSQLERTIAVGPFRIYRAPGSVAFLNSGSALQPILPKSQCWCIDEINSRFVLQIRRPSYWRIELPVDDPEDQRRAEALREVFDKILQFEKTECPFKRAFTIELPDQQPITWRPWTPMQRPLPDTPAFDSGTPVSSIDSRRSSFAARTSTPTPFSDRHLPEFSTSPPSSRPTSSASCGPSYVQFQVAKSESMVESLAAEPIHESKPLRVWDDKPTQTAKIMPEEHFDRRLQSPDFDPVNFEAYASKPLNPVLERPSETDSADPFLFNSAEASRQASLGSGPKRLAMPASIQELDADVKDARESQFFSTETYATSYNGESSPPSSSSVYGGPSLLELHEGSGYRGDRMKARLRRTTGFTMPRSATMPSHLSLSMDKPSAPKDTTTPVQEPKEKLEKLEKHPETVGAISPDAANLPAPTGKEKKDRPQMRRRDSEESFHSVESWHSSSAPLHPSPPTSQPGSPIDESAEKTSGTTNSPVMPCAWESDSDGEDEVSHESVATAPHSSPTLSSKGHDTGVPLKDAPGESTTTPVRRRPAHGHRATTSSISVRRRALSPLPPAANLFTPVSTAERKPYRSKLETVKNLPMAIIMKTCEMLIGPPSHLIALMLRVAAKIISGQWRGLVYGYSDNGEEIPVQWDYSEGEFSDWSDDEPYMGPHNGHRRHHSNHGSKSQETSIDSVLTEQLESSDDSRSWGVD